MRICRFKKLISVCLCLVMLLCGFSATAAEGKVVRVGFFAFNGYHNVDAHGNRSGYGYEYLQHMARYVKWNYEYVGYENSWLEMLEMLRNGEIDLLTSAQKTPERLEEFEFSEQPIGTSATILTVKAKIGNPFFDNDYSKLQGIRVGMLRGSSRNDSFASFAAENGFDYTTVYFNNDDEMIAELQLDGGAIDAAVTSNLRVISNEWVVAQFDASPFYAMVKKGNTELLSEVNFAIEEIGIHTPGLQSDLFNAYYSAQVEDKIAFSAAEAAYVKEQNKKEQLTAVVLPGCAPLCYYEDGTAHGIVVEIAKEAIKRSGLNVKFLTVQSRGEYDALVESGGVDIVLDMPFDLNNAERLGFKLTNAYMELPYVQVNGTGKTVNAVNATIAATKNAWVTRNFVETRFTKDQIVYYDSDEASLEAVRDGKQDICFTNEYSAGYAVYHDVKKELSFISHNYVNGVQLVFGVNEENDPMLLSVLSKALDSLSKENIETIITRETTYPELPFSLSGYIFSNPDVSLLILAILSLVLISIIAYVARSVRYKAQKAQSAELARFVSYVCRANNEVGEIDLAKRRRYKYDTKDGKVVITHTPFMGLDETLKALHPADRDNVRKLLLQNKNEVVDEGKELVFEARAEVCGTYRWFSYKLQRLDKEKAGSRSFMLYKHDIDDVKTAEVRRQNEIHLREKRLSEITTQEYDFQITVDLDTLAYSTMQFSSSCPDIYFAESGDYAREFERFCAEHAHPDDLEGLIRFHSPKGLRRECSLAPSTPPSIRYRLSNPLSVQWVESSIYFSESDGKKMAYILNKVVTKRVLTELAVTHVEQERRQRAHELAMFISYVCSANDNVFEVDIKRKTRARYYMDGSRVMKEPAEFPSEEYLEEWIHPDDLEKVKAHYSPDVVTALVENGTGESYEYRLRVDSAEGRRSFHWFRCTHQGMLRDDAHPCSMIVFNKDIDDVKRAEGEKQQLLEDALVAAEKASAAKGVFTSRMSHEIRTPLNAVIGYMTIAKSSDSIEKVHSCIDKAESSAKHLLRIINDVLDISAIESGKMKISLESFEINQVITSLAATYHAQAQMKGVEFDVVIDNLEDEWLVGDQMRLSQILINLIGNAIKFTPSEGKVTLRVSQSITADSMVHLRFSVEDTGIGMKPEFMSSVFAPFEQQDAGITRSFGGNGLGLSITKNLVTMMRGTITAESEPDKGSVFTVELPFQRDSTKHKETTQDFSGVHAMVVDDEAHVREYVSLLLNRFNVRNEVYESARDALGAFELAASNGDDYNLCIIDWKMPELDGLETVKAMRRRAKNDVRFAIITGYDVSAAESELREAGVSIFISKPVFQSVMLNMLMNNFGSVTEIDVQANSEQSVCFEGKRLLLAEDNEMNMEIATEILKQAGFEVDCAYNGADAYEIFVDSPAGTYCGILMDVMMPVMNGHEAARKIRSSAHPEAATIPIIAMTANAFTEDISASLAAGMNDHVSKPVDVAQLFETLNRHVV